MKLLSWLNELRSTRSKSQRRRRRRGRRALPSASGHVEILEARTLLSNIFVTSTSDSVDAADGVTTLREAILEANGDSIPDTIKFNIPLTDAGATNIDSDQSPDVFVIRPRTPLPVLNSSGGTTFDGFSQTSFTGDTNQSGPEIILDGSVMADTGEILAGLHLASNNSEVWGLNIRNFAGFGIYAPADGIRILGNYIGTDATGMSAQGNGEGIRIEGTGSIIGADLTDATVRNVISGNGAGIRTYQSSQTVVQGNYVGTTADGLSALANTNGIFDAGTDSRFGSNADGVLDAAERNIISGNTNNGIWLSPPSQGATVAGNYIGISVAGSNTIPNQVGVFLASGGGAVNVSDATIGGTTAAARNIISGNLQAGITGGGDSLGVRIQGNYIGTDVTGTLKQDANGNPFGNQTGISFTSSFVGGGLIGGTEPGAGNLVSGNLGNGMSVGFVVVQGNYVGLDATGTRSLGNGGIGIVADRSAIGGTEVGAGNVVSANAGFGIDARGATIQGNIIGYDASGTLTVDVDGNPLGNSTFIDVQTRNSTAFGAPVHSIVGGTAPTAGNLVSKTLFINSGTTTVQGNNILFVDVGATEDVLIGGSEPGEANIIRFGIDLRGSTRTRVQGNYIGVATDGTTRNGRGGIRIGDGAVDNIIGTDGDGTGDDAEGNILTFLEINGASLTNASRETSGNRVAGNMIGTNQDGTQALGDGGWVSITHGASHNVIGTNGDGASDAVERNVIVGHLLEPVFGRSAAVYIDGFDNAVAGNFIGTDVTGTIDFGNTGHGVEVNSFASFALYNRIGTNGDGVSDDLEGNVIAFSGQAGFATNGFTNGHTVRGNSIYSNDGLGIDHDFDGVTPNDTDTLVPGGPNGNISNRQNFPVLTSVLSGAQTNIFGTLNSLPNTRFLIDFYVVDEADPSGYGEGQQWLGFTEVESDSNGDANFDVTLPITTVEGQIVTATATRFEDTDENPTTAPVPGETSEFSAAFAAEGLETDQFVTNTNDSGPGSLRQAILNANTITGPNTIFFDIPRADPGGVDVDADGLNDVFVIHVLSALPTLDDSTGGTQVDGRTQPKFADGDGPRVVLSGGQLPHGGITISSNHNAVLAINIRGFGGDGIDVQGGDANWIAGNYIGTDHTGSVADGNGTVGVRIRGGGNDNIIGTNGDGLDDGVEGNIVSGNRVGVFITGDGNDRNVLAGNHIGVDATGTQPIGNLYGGVIVNGSSLGSDFTRVGTNGDGISDAIERNIISGNGGDGIYLVRSHRSVVAGNLIGVDINGASPLPNSGNGVFLESNADDNRIGTNGDGVADAAEGNVISGNGNMGVLIDKLSDDNLIAGNLIGTDVSADNPLGNRVGVAIGGQSTNNTIGGGPELANVIAFNIEEGVLLGTTVQVLDAANSNSIRANSIHSNGALGIDLSGSNGDLFADGVTANDSDSRVPLPGPDPRANDLQNYPVLSLAIAGNTTQIYGSLTSTPDSQFVIDVYANQDLDTSGHGEGERYLGSFDMTTDASGFASFGTDRFVDGATTSGEFISTTATRLEDRDGDANTPPVPTDTSEFSAALEALGTDLFVRNTNDSGPGSLRQAILNANAITGPNTIHFDIPSSDAGGIDVDADGVNDVFVIQPASELPHISDSTGGTIIDGRTQHGYVAGEGPRIVLDGGTRIYDVLTILSDGNAVFGLNIQGYRRMIRINGGDSNWIAGNYIGTDRTGTVAPLGLLHGVYVDGGGSENIIGTDGDGLDDAAEKNVITTGGTEFGMGVVLSDGSDHNLVAGNHIGVDVTGTVGLGADNIGVLISGNFNRIGTNGDGVSDAIERNVISGNELGVYIFWSRHNAVSGNYIGVDVTGTKSIPHSGWGVVLDNSQYNLIGTDGNGRADPVERNLISGNFDYGVSLGKSDYNVIAGNFLGTDVTGRLTLGNRGGVSVSDGRGNLIGTNGDGIADDAERNIISGGRMGVFLGGPNTEKNMIAGNYIGTDVTGTNPLSNLVGVGASRGAADNQIGGSLELANVIAFNTEQGVRVTLEPSISIYSDSAGNSIRINSIHSNGGLGIDLDRSGQFGDGVTPNDPGDVDTGPNDLQNFPELLDATADGVLVGSLQSVPNSQFIIDFYYNDFADPSGYGEGRDYLEAVTVSTDSSGSATFEVKHAFPLSIGGFVTATATRLDDRDGDPSTPPVPGSTSEFSRAIAVTAGQERFGSDGDDQFLIEAGDTLDQMKVTLTNVQGQETFLLSSANVKLFGQGGSDTFVVDGLPNGRFLLIDAGDQDDVIEINSNNPSSTVRVLGGNGADRATVNASPNAFVDLGDGDDVYTVNFGDQFEFMRTVRLADSSGVDSLLINGTDQADHIEKMADTVTHQYVGFPTSSPSEVQFSGIEDVTIDGGAGDDLIIDPGENTTLLGGPGDDTLIVTETFGNGIVVDGNEGADTIIVELGNLAGPVTISDTGTTGKTTVRIVGTPADDVMTLSSTQLSSNGEIVNLNLTSGNVQLILDGGEGQDQVNVEESLPQGVELTLDSLTQAVQIDVQPFRRHNSLNVTGFGGILVGLYSTDSFDVTQVDLSTVTFAGAHVDRSWFKDLDGDGDLDLLLRFRVGDTNLRQVYEDLFAADISEDGILDSRRQLANVRLSGSTFDGNWFEGRDTLALHLHGRALLEILRDLFGG